MVIPIPQIVLIKHSLHGHSVNSRLIPQKQLLCFDNFLHPLHFSIEITILLFFHTDTFACLGIQI